MSYVGNNAVGILGGRFHALLSHGLVAVLLLAVSGQSLAGLADGLPDATLVPSDRKEFQWFGHSVALSGDGNTAAVGAPGYRAVYVFARKGLGWRQTQKLTLRRGLGCSRRGSILGWSVALSRDGRTSLVGASGRIFLGIVPFKIGCRAALVFIREGGRWIPGGRLTAPRVLVDDLFGWAVALSGNGRTAVVGAQDTDCPGAPDCGAAYVFERMGTKDWRVKRTLRGIADSSLGWSVALSANGRWALAGAPSANATFAFRKRGNRWIRSGLITVPTSGTGDFFGSAVALSGKGTSALVGAEFADECRGIRLTSCGNVHRFVRPGGIWTLQSMVTASDVDQFYHFGESVALSQNGLRAIVGTSGADCPTGNCGAAYVYDAQGGVLVERGRVTSPTAGTGAALLG
ncbi:MAG: hypothetical protein ACREVJ_07770 [Gammaproteobacteria bacterium]